MKKAFIMAILGAAFSGFFIIPAYPQCVVQRANEKIKYTEETPDDRVKSIQEAIKNVNLLNSLNLKKEQLVSIIRYAQDIEKISKDTSAQFVRLYAKKLYRVEQKIRQQVENGRTVLDKDVAAEYDKIKKLNVLLFYRRNNKMRDGISAVEKLLEDFQLLALDAYIPCVVPIVQDGFIGGVGKAISFTDFLRHGRKIPEKNYEILREKLISLEIENWKSLLLSCKELYDESIAREEMLKSLEQVRKLDDVDFKLQVDKIAEELAQKIVLEEPEISRQVKIQRFLLSGQSIPILKKRLEGKK
jgi:hypothetical protein